MDSLYAVLSKVKRCQTRRRRSSGPMMLFAMTLFYPHIVFLSSASLPPFLFPLCLSNNNPSSFRSSNIRQRKIDPACSPAPREQSSPPSVHLSASAGHRLLPPPTTSNTNYLSLNANLEASARASTLPPLSGRASIPNQKIRRLPSRSLSPAQRRISLTRHH